MIEAQTVLVLGAGASIPYGYPSGLLLRQAVGTESRRNQLVGHHGFDPELVDRFQQELARSACLSVDAFLEHRTEFLEVGKMATALELIPRERDDSLFTTEDSNWYNLLFAAMNSSWGNFSSNRVSFVTFNYDRSLERFLSEATLHKFGKSSNEVSRVLSSFPIIHVHGTLSSLSDRPYSTDTSDPALLRKAAESIRIIHEGSAATEFEEARNLLKDAKRIYFIGFGYHPTNLKRLGTRFLRTDTEVYGSAYGLTSAETARIRNDFVNGIIAFGQPTHDSTAFLRHATALDFPLPRSP